MSSVPSVSHSTEIYPSVINPATTGSPIPPPPPAKPLVLHPATTGSPGHSYPDIAEFVVRTLQQSQSDPASKPKSDTKSDPKSDPKSKPKSNPRKTVSSTKPTVSQQIAKSLISVDISKQVKDFLSSKGLEDILSDFFFPTEKKINLNDCINVTIKDNQLKTQFIDAIKKKFLDNKMNSPIDTKDFNFVQNVIRCTEKDPSIHDPLIEIVANCIIYTKNRTNLLKNIKPYILEEILAKNENCFKGRIHELNLAIFRSVDLDILSKLVDNDWNKLTDEQFEMLCWRPNISRELKDILKKSKRSSHLCKPDSNIKTEELSVTFPPSSPGPVKKAPSKKAPSKIMSPKKETPKQTPPKQTPSKQTPPKQTPPKQNPDANVILKEIQEYLQEIKPIENFKPTSDLSNTDIILGNTQISAKCMLFYFSTYDKKFMNDLTQEDCSNKINSYIANNKFDFGKLFYPTGKKTLSYDVYKNLYEFTVSMINYIATTNNFKNSTPVTKSSILNNLVYFINNVFEYLIKFMKSQKIMEQSLMTSGYNLLLLRNVMTSQQVNADKNIKDLMNVYDKLKKTIDDNINLYQKIQTKSPSTIQPSTTQEIDTEIKNLTDTVNNLDAKQKEIHEQLKKIDTDHKELSKLADDTTKKIATAMQ